MEINSGPLEDRKSKQFRPKVINLKAADFLMRKSAVVGASALSQTRWPRAWRSIANGGLPSATDVIHRQPKLLHHVAIQSGPCEAVLAFNTRANRLVSIEWSCSRFVYHGFEIDEFAIPGRVDNDVGQCLKA